MRLANIAVLAFAACILAKNVFYLDTLRAALDKESGNSKRDARNVVSLEDFKHAVDEEQQLHKRQDVVETDPLLQSLLPQVPALSIFSRYLRDDRVLGKRIDEQDAFTLLFAPSDEAIAKYSARTGLKPWEYPKDVSHDDTDEAANYNINYFLRAHMLTEHAQFGDHNGLSTVLLDGKKVRLTRDEATDSYTVAVDNKVLPVAMVLLAGNGVVFVLGTVLDL